MAKISLKSCIETIKLIENRLSLVKSRGEVNSAHSSADYTPNFPPHMECHYSHLLAESYFTIYFFYSETADRKEIPKTGFQIRDTNFISFDKDQIAFQCLKYSDASLSIASTHLPVTSPLRLLCIYSHCKYLSKIFHNLEKAKELATNSFYEACRHTNQLMDAPTIKLLQKIRDEFMTIDTSQKPADATYAPPIFTKDISKHSSDGDTRPILSSKKSEKGGSVQKEKTSTPHLTLATNISGFPDAEVDKGAELVKRLHKVVSLPVPIIFESLPSSNSIFKALDQIFRVYIRGNVLPGQQSGGRLVDMDGRTVSFRSFVLNGPFISWKGFMNVLLQFSIAKPPAANTPTGRSYHKSFNFHSGGTAGGGGFLPVGPVGAEALLEMSEAAALFIECSRSAAPLLVLTRYSAAYAEMAESLAEQRRALRDRDSDRDKDRDRDRDRDRGDRDSWQAVAEWANLSDRSSQKWEISAGLNFVQFVDCLGKCGAVAYSGPRFREALPTPAEKVQHFLSAHLGLADSSKWFGKVDARLKFIKNLASSLGSNRTGNGNGNGNGIASSGDSTGNDGRGKQGKAQGSSGLKQRAASAGRRS